jgi:DNA repair exonuclease SbcCD ATPase subunit
MPKRVVVTKEPATKKTKFETAAIVPETPLLEALVGVDSLPNPCRQLLQVALPYCLATPPSDRHKFQLQMLDRITTIFDSIEEQRRAALNEEEGQLVSAQAEKDAANVELEAQRAATSKKKEECDEKGKHASTAKESFAQHKEATNSAEKQAEELVSNKAKLEATQESFQGILKDCWEPLKDGVFPGTQWAKRNKTIVEFIKKMGDQVQMEGSLLDALEVALKIKPEQRTSFALLALEHAEARYKDRAECLTQEISALADARQAYQAAIDNAKSAQDEKQKELEDAEKDWDMEQSQWVELENSVAAAAQALEKKEDKVQDSKTVISSMTDDLEKFREIPALLSKLKFPTATEEEAVEIGASEEAPQIPVSEALEPEAQAPMVEAA